MRVCYKFLKVLDGFGHRETYGGGISRRSSIVSILIQSQRTHSNAVDLINSFTWRFNSTIFELFYHCFCALNYAMTHLYDSFLQTFLTILQAPEILQFARSPAYWISSVSSSLASIVSESAAVTIWETSKSLVRKSFASTHSILDLSEEIKVTTKVLVHITVRKSG